MLLESPQALLNIKTFLQRFHDKEKHLQNVKITRDHTALSSFLRNFHRFEKLAFQLRAHSATYFNVFQVMRLGSYEEKLHTPFLAHLLNPAGAHSQRRLFFDAFLSAVIPVKVILSDISHIEVLSEHNTPYGRIDILIKYWVNKNPRAIVVENKVYAPDQHLQMERYHDFLRKTLGLSIDDFFMIYLSPWKKKPSFENKENPEAIYSITKELYDSLCKNYCFVEIGYHTHIIPFLNYCVGHIKAPVVAETVKQYLKTIQNL